MIRRDGGWRSNICYIVGLIFAGAGCGTIAKNPQISQGSWARSTLVINEIAPQPETGPDWIEIANRGDKAIDLCGYFLTDSRDRLDHYVSLGGVLPPDRCPPRLLGPGQYLVVFADDKHGVENSHQIHAPFKLGNAEEVHLLTTQGNAIDSLVYVYQRHKGGSLSRWPDQSGPFYQSRATPGATNVEHAAIAENP